jgi:hypothetical protein
MLEPRFVKCKTLSAAALDLDSIMPHSPKMLNDEPNLQIALRDKEDPNETASRTDN